MRKFIFVTLCLIAFAGALISLSRKPPIFSNAQDSTPREHSITKHAAAQSYSCGRFGSAPYLFPEVITGPIIEYVGDDPWAGNIGDKDRGCADEYEGLVFSACLPNVDLYHYGYKGNSDCIFGVRIFRSVGDESIGRLASLSRSPGFSSGRLDRYDPALGLNYFDVKEAFVSRVFWRPATVRGPSIFARCNVEAPYPRCQFKMFSHALRAAISVSFPMSHIGRWEQFLHGAESQLEKYKI